MDWMLYLFIGICTSAFCLWVYTPYAKRKYNVDDMTLLFSERRRLLQERSVDDYINCWVFVGIIGLCSVYLWPLVHVAVYVYAVYHVMDCNPFVKEKESKYESGDSNS